MNIWTFVLCVSAVRPALVIGVDLDIPNKQPTSLNMGYEMGWSWALSYIHEWMACRLTDIKDKDRRDD
jgi:hypothetical protein